MAEMVLDCPYCGANAMFKFVAEDEGHGSPFSKYTWNTLYVCPNCSRGAVVRLQSPHKSPKPSACQTDPRKNGFKIEAIHPKPKQTDVPRHLPDKIADDYKEAMTNLRQQEFTSAGIMFRKVLERSTLTIGPDSATFQKKDLQKRIESLDKELQAALADKIIPAMKAMAHTIREKGNTATHGEEKFTKAEANQIQRLTELFLHCAFTLPPLLKEAREK